MCGAELVIECPVTNLAHECFFHNSKLIVHVTGRSKLVPLEIILEERSQVSVLEIILSINNLEHRI